MCAGARGSEQNPTLIASFGDSVGEPIFVGDALVAAAPIVGIRIWDVADPDDIQGGRSIGIDATDLRIEPIDQRTIAAFENTDVSSILLLDVSNPASIELSDVIGFVDDVTDIDVGEERLFATILERPNSSRINIYDITNPDDAVLISSSLHPLSIDELAVVDDRLYALAGGFLNLFDISDLAAPVRLGEIRIDGWSNIHPLSDMLALTGANGLALLRTTPTAPFEFVSQLPGTFGNAISFPNDHTAIATEPQGSEILVIDIADRASPEITSTLPLPNGWRGSPVATPTLDRVAIRGSAPSDLPGASKQLGIFQNDAGDLRESFSTLRRNETFPRSDVFRGIMMAQSGRYYDFRDPRAPVLLGTVPPPNDPQTPGYTSACDGVFLGTYQLFTGVGILWYGDFRNPAGPQWTGQLSLGNGLLQQRCRVQDDILYFIEGDFLSWYDLANLGVFGSVGEIEPAARDVAASRDHFYVANDRGFQVYRRFGFGSELVREVVTNGALRGLATRGELLYAANGTAGMLVYDITDPADPIMIGHADTPGEATDIAVVDGRAFVADATGGVQVIDVSDPTTPAAVGDYSDLRADRVELDLGLLYAFNGDILHVLDISAAGVSPCLGDWNTDGRTDTFDILAFLQAFSNADPTADVNDDGVFDFFDVSRFLTDFEAGCPT